MRSFNSFDNFTPRTYAKFAVLLSAYILTSLAVTQTVNCQATILNAGFPHTAKSAVDSSLPDAPRTSRSNPVTRSVESAAYGGDHEVGVIAGYSGVSGPIWGYRKDVKYTLVTARYSYLMLVRRPFTIRYSPEITVAARLDEPIFIKGTVQNGRQHSYGGGISPVGFQLTGSQRKRLQPFAAMNGGMIYFNNRVLSPQGSQFMYTIDFGGGVNLFATRRKAISIGYRYQHLSNANISLHNPGTDANTFYIGASWFHTHGVR